MHQTLWQRLDQIARRCVPFGLTALLMLFGLTPTHIPGFSPIAPMFPLMAVYFWSVYRPDSFGYGPAFGIGLFEDLLAGTPLGSTALVLMLGQWIVFHQQKFFNGRPFHVVWSAFALVAVAAAMMQWLTVGLFSAGGFVAPGQAMTSAVMTIATYPVVGWLLAKAQLKLLVQP